MKVSSSNKTNKSPKIIIGIIILILLLGGGSFYAYATNLFGWKAKPATSSPSTVNYSNPSSYQIKAGDTTKATSANSGSTSASSSSTDTSSGKTNVAISITVSQETSSAYQIRSLIDSVTNSGTCTLTLTKTGSATVTKTAGVQAQSSSSTCEGFDIPLSNLSAGNWSYTLAFENTASTGSTSGTITVN